MLETTISARILAAFFASVVALALLPAAWVIDRPVVGMLGLVAANVCTVLVIQHDHAKTRRLLRHALRETSSPVQDMRSVR
jgi:hypothetical protein